MEGSLHCRPAKKSWRPKDDKQGHEGNKFRQSTMKPAFDIKSDADPDPIILQMTITNMDY